MSDVIKLAPLTLVSAANDVRHEDIMLAMPHATIKRRGHVWCMYPETHRHPRGQEFYTLDMISRVNDGERIIVQTYSEVVLLTVQTAVAEGVIAPRNVRLVWFDAALTPHVGRIDRAGAYGSWPCDFAAHMAELECRYLDAAERVLERH